MGMRKKPFIWKITITAIIIIFFVFLIFLDILSYWWNSQQYLGITFSETGKGLVITKIKSGSIAEKTGLKPEDLILSVNDEEVLNLQEYRKKERDFRKTKKVNFSFQRNEQIFTASLSPEIQAPWGSIFSILVIVCVYLGIGLLSLWKKSEDLKVRLLFLLTVFASLTVVIPDYFSQQKEFTAQILTLLLSISYGILIGVEPHLAMVIPKKKVILEKHPWIIRLFYATGIIVAVLFFVNYLDSIYKFGFHLLFSKIVIFLFIILYQLVTPLLVFGILLHTFFKTPLGVRKSQIKVVLFGIFPWVVSMLCASLAWIIRGELSPFLYYFNLVAIIPVPFAFSIAIFKYRLFNVELVIRKSLIYGFLTGFLFLVYYATIGLGSAFFSIFFIKASSVWVIAFATLLLGLIFNPVRKKIHFYVDKFFYPEKYKLRQQLPEISREIASVTNLNALVNRILDKLSLLLNMNSSAFLLSDERLEKYLVYATRGRIEPFELEKSVIFSANEEVIQYLAQQRKPLTKEQFSNKIKQFPGFFKLQKFQPEIIVPFFLKDSLIAILILGGKQSEDRYDREDRNLLAIFSNQVAAMLENARLFQFATFDDLTGLYRRRVFEKELEKEIERSRRFNRPLVVGLVDIDHFKKINDDYGHSTGDIVLKNIAMCLKVHIRSIDCLARYGGEEFIFFLPETDINSGKKMGEKLREIVENLNLFLEDDSLQVRVTISVGITCWRGEDRKVNVESLVKLADQALYQAKSRGRNRTEVVLCD